MANEKFKLVFNDSGGKTVTFTQNNPKLDSTDNDKQLAMEAIGDMYQYSPVSIVLNSDTTVWTAA